MIQVRSFTTPLVRPPALASGEWVVPARERRTRTLWGLTVLFVVCLCILGARPTLAAGLKSIQSGNATVVDGSSSAVVSISPVDPGKAFLVFSLRHDIDNPADSMVTGQIAAPNSLVFERVGTGTDVAVEWSVVEFVSGVSVQRGTEPLDAPIKNVGISSVDLTKSFSLATLRIGGTVTSDDDFIRARLTSPTNLELAAFNDRADAVIEWQVVEYADASVQTGDVSFLSSEATKTATVPVAVDPDKAWLIYSYRTQVGTPSNTGQKVVRGLVTGSTSLQFDRDRTGQSIELAWQLVEFQDLTTVQHANAAFSSAEL
jgi:hypothetical protein